MSGSDRTLLAAALSVSAGNTLGDGQPRRRLMGRFFGSSGGGSEGVILREEEGRWYWKQVPGKMRGRPRNLKCLADLQKKSIG